MNFISGDNKDESEKYESRKNYVWSDKVNDKIPLWITMKFFFHYFHVDEKYWKNKLIEKIANKKKLIETLCIKLNEINL